MSCYADPAVRPIASTWDSESSPTMYMRGSDTFHSTTSRLWLCPRGRACKPQRRNRRPRVTTWSTYRTRVSLWGRVRKSTLCVSTMEGCAHHARSNTRHRMPSSTADPFGPSGRRSDCSRPTQGTPIPVDHRGAAAYRPRDFPCEIRPELQMQGQSDLGAFLVCGIRFLRTTSALLQGCFNRRNWLNQAVPYSARGAREWQKK